MRLRAHAWLALAALLPLEAACGDDAAQEPSTDAASALDADTPLDAAVRMDAALPSPDAGDRRDASDEDAGDDDAGSIADAGPMLPARCAEATTPPATLDCTGLYADVASKQLFPGVRGYAPAYALWSDGSSKRRWISLPAQEPIDNTDRNEWVFPIGTKLFKEFVRDGKRIETRMWHKAGTNFWVNAAYAWNDDETAADRTAGGDIILADGSSYHIPTQDECEKCHRGRTERILGFDQVLLGLPGAEGVTLRDLIDEARLTQAPAADQLEIGDDGSGLAPSALGWLHANCGVTCHNANSRAIGYPTGLRLRLDPDQLDGRAVIDFESYATTVGEPVTTASWRGRTRIVPGHPEQSFLYQLITSRGEGMQMPPFASSRVDAVNAALVGDWIRHMTPLDPDDDAGVDEPDSGHPPPPPGGPQ